MIEDGGVPLTGIPLDHTYIPIRNARVLDATSLKAFGLALRRFQAASEMLGAARTRDADRREHTAMREGRPTGKGRSSRPGLYPLPWQVRSQRKLLSMRYVHDSLSAGKQSREQSEVPDGAASAVIPSHSRRHRRNSLIVNKLSLRYSTERKNCARIGCLVFSDSYACLHNKLREAM